MGRDVRKNLHVVMSIILTKDIPSVHIYKFCRSSGEPRLFYIIIIYENYACYHQVSALINSQQIKLMNSIFGKITFSLEGIVSMLTYLKKLPVPTLILMYFKVLNFLCISVFLLMFFHIFGEISSRHF